MFCKMDRCICEEWQVQSIQPDNRLATFIPMVMPVPVKRCNHISVLHWDLLPVNGCVSTGASFDDQSKGNRGVPMCGSDFAREYNLQPSVNCVRGVRRIYTEISWSLQLGFAKSYP